MNKMKNRIIATGLAFICCGAGISAQDLNPTVEVSRQYQGQLMEVHKPVMEMALPDSVDKFNLEFDYSVFENPFRSSYEFSPSVLNVDLAPDASGSRRLYLKAGAGFSLHPELDLVWTPVDGRKFRMSVYGFHRSYIGNYMSLEMRENPDKTLSPGRSNRRYSGYDMLSKAGISGNYDWENGGLYFDAGYYGVAVKDTLVSRGYDAVDIRFGVSSKDNSEGKFVYRADAAYRYAEDKFVSDNPAGRFLGEHDFDLGASFGKMFRSGHSVYVDLGFDMASYSGIFGSFAANATCTPGYVFNNGRWHVDAGVEIAVLIRDNDPAFPEKMNTHKGQVIYPDIRFSFDIIRKYLDVYLEIGGGPDINSYSSLLASDHHLTPFYNPAGYALLDNTEERVSAVLGFSGNIASRFRYDVRTGFRDYANSPLYMIYTVDGAGNGPLYLSGMDYAPYRSFFAGLDWAWTSQDVEAGGYFTYNATDVASRYDYLFAPAPFTGYAEIMYNWNGRIRAGVGCEYSSSRRTGTAAGYVIPWYADLGLYAEFALTRKFSLWCRGGNLLNMTIRRTPLYAESGIYFTAGIRLNL